jgi:uncharacterized membrane protein (UPF0182 family)
MSRRRLAGYSVAAVFVILFGGRWMAIRFTEASWFADLGLAATYWTRFFRGLLWHGVTAVAATLWYAVQTIAVYRSISAVHLPRRVGDLEIAEAVPRRTLRWIAVGIAVVLGIVTAITFSEIPDLVALYRHATPLGLREPILGRDASFYLSRLPLLETVQLAALVLVLFGLFVAGLLYALTGSITYAERRLRATPHARAHLVALAACLALVMAWGFQLDAYGIVGGGGAAAGAVAAADRAVRIPAATALSALALVVAAVTAASLRWRRTALVATVWATLGAAAVLGRWVAPFLSDAWRGKPDREVALALAQFADRYSRAGLGVLDRVPTERLDARAVVPAESLASLGADLGGLSTWATEPALLDGALASILADSASPRSWESTLDRYPGTSGQPILTALAVPETDLLALDRATSRPDWTAVHRGPLSWAGDPVAVAVSDRPGPGFTFLGRLDPVSDSGVLPVPVARAPGRIRFLVRQGDLAIVGPDEPVPRGAPVGLRLGGLVRRLLLAWALQSPPLLERRTSVADRILIWRDVPRRLARLYPFASFAGPHAALVDGRVLWIADGYLASARFPLADHVPWQGEPVNFLRAPYVATVDAVSGVTRLYLRPPGLAFAQALAGGFGSPPLPSDSMSAALRRHLGYPEDLFAAQVEMLARHHGEVAATALPWVVSRREPADGAPATPQPPIAALVAIGREAPRLWRLLPLTDGEGKRLAAIAAATADDDGTLRTRLLRLPDAGLFPTPAAAASRFAASPAVVAAVAGAGGPEGSVRRSDVVAVPVAGTVAYVQFVFGSIRRTDAPLLPRGVALLAGGQVGIGDGIAAAARSLVRSQGSAPFGAASAATLEEARAAFGSLDSAVRRGDWAGFGRAYELLRRVLGPPAPGPRRP